MPSGGVFQAEAIGDSKCKAPEVGTHRQVQCGARVRAGKRGAGGGGLEVKPCGHWGFELHVRRWSGAKSWQLDLRNCIIYGRYLKA